MILIWIINFFIIIAGISFYVFELNQYFLQCPNKEFLLWDANIRLIQSLDSLQMIKLNQHTQAIKILLESPTWPPLRSLLSMILILFSGKVDPVLDTRWSIVFFYLTIFIIHWGIFLIFYQEKKSQLLYLLTSYIAIGFLMLLQQIPEYLFNSMLEIQGMFLYTSFIFLIYFYYKNSPDYKYFKIIFFINGFLIYFTKYPYGVLISIVFIILELIRNPENFFSKILLFLKTYRGLRSIFIILPIFTIIFILIGPHLMPQVVNKKFIKNYMYFSLLLFFIDLSIFLYRKNFILISKNLNFFYWYFIFPFFIVIFSNPDRFHSLIGAQVDTIDRGRSFFISIFTEYFYTNYLFIIIIFLSILSIIYSIYKNYKNNLSFFFNNPSILIILFLWLHLLILEFLTTNHQARYIFQILPGILIFHSFIIIQFSSYRYQYITGLFFVLIISTNFYYLYNKYSPEKREVCFSGKNPEIFDPIRSIKPQIPPELKAIVFNEFHYYKKNNQHLNNPYLFIPTDIDFHLRAKVYPSGYIFNYNKKLINQSIKFDSFIYITYDCKNHLKNSKYFPDFEGKEINFYREKILFQDPFICIKILSKE